MAKIITFYFYHFFVQLPEQVEKAVHPPELGKRRLNAKNYKIKM